MKRKLTKLLRLFCLFSIIVVPPFAQAQEEVLTNDSIQAMTKAGLTTSIIVAKIRSSKTQFSLSTDELLRLKKESVADAVIEAMMQASQSAAFKTVASENQPSKVEPGDPTSPRESGVYLFKESNGQRQLIQIEPTVYSQSKSGGFFKSSMTRGIAKVKSKAVIAGSDARVKTEDSRPVFYFYFELKSSGLSNSGNTFMASATSPNEFVLVKMESKKNNRELVVGQINAFGAQSGAMDKDTHPFDYEKIASGIYKVRPKGNLPEGEYCFFYAGSPSVPTYGGGTVGSPKVFDFGITVSRLN